MSTQLLTTNERILLKKIEELKTEIEALKVSAPYVVPIRKVSSCPKCNWPMYNPGGGFEWVCTQGHAWRYGEVAEYNKVPTDAGWTGVAPAQPHKLNDAGSNPAPATKEKRWT